jgi:phosphate transport system permease protein
MTTVDAGSAGRSPVHGRAAAESIAPATAPPRTTLPERTTLPARPAGGRKREPRPLTLLRLADVVSVIGAFLAALATTGMLWQEVSPFSGILGFVIATWCLFVFYYAVLVSFSEDRQTVRDRLSAVVVQSLAALVFAALFFVIIYTLVRAFPALRHLNFYTQDGRAGSPLTPLTQSGGLHAVVGTLIELGIALGISVPFGLLAAVFVNEVPGRYARFIRTVVDAMTAMPDVLAGLFIYATLILILGLPLSGFCAGCALGVTALPIVCRASDVVMRLMPGGLTEASYALGAGQWRTVRYVTLPTVRSGLATAVILGAARAIGETAPVLLTAGATNYLSFKPLSGPMMSLPLMAYTFVEQPASVQIARGFGAAALLLILVVLLFAIARAIGGRGPGQLSSGQQRRRTAASQRDLARFTRRAGTTRPAWQAQGANPAEAGPAGARQ